MEQGQSQRSISYSVGCVCRCCHDLDSNPRSHAWEPSILTLSYHVIPPKHNYKSHLSRYPAGICTIVLMFDCFVALAHEFMKAGCRLILAARSIDKLERLKLELVEMYKVPKQINTIRFTLYQFGKNEKTTP